MNSPVKLLLSASVLLLLAAACSKGLSEEETRSLVDAAVAEAVEKVAAQSVPVGVLTATEFRLVDEDGLLRASLNFDESGAAGLQIFDQEEVARVQLFVSDAQGIAGMSLADERGVGRLDTFVGDQGEPVILLFDQRGTIRSRLGLNATGVPGLFMHDIGGVERSIFGQAGDGSGSIALYERNGELELVIPEIE